ncbi:MAG TPA: exodeoxyribonuclease VII large subunit [Candidatus Saccharimonadales bacterium]|jgi:exodeoxyribonuclease VII large subunit
MFDDLPDVSVTVSEFVDLLNETYEFAFPSIVISGELANLRISKNKWLYFDLKDDGASVKFFGNVHQLPGPLEDGMLLNVRGTPHMHELYGFSVNVQFIQPAGKGSIRRAAELLQAKLQAEGLFDDSRKRSLPYPPRRIGLITSAQSAAYADFIKILGARWGGLAIELIDVQVQGEAAPAQIIAAIDTFNETADPPEILVMIRGGGSADDLATWSHEHVTRAVAGSRVPTLVAIGHEIDTSLAELAADSRASTPSNAAELLTPDKKVVLQTLSTLSEELYDAVQDRIHDERTAHEHILGDLTRAITGRLQWHRDQLDSTRALLAVLSPDAALKRGYAIVRDARHKALQTTSSSDLPAVGDIVHIELLHSQLSAAITSVQTLQRTGETK